MRCVFLHRRIGVIQPAAYRRSLCRLRLCRRDRSRGSFLVECLGDLAVRCPAIFQLYRFAQKISSVRLLLSARRVVFPAAGAAVRAVHRLRRLDIPQRPRKLRVRRDPRLLHLLDLALRVAEPEIAGEVAVLRHVLCLRRGVLLLLKNEIHHVRVEILLRLRVRLIPRGVRLILCVRALLPQLHNGSDTRGFVLVQPLAVGRIQPQPGRFAHAAAVASRCHLLRQHAQRFHVVAVELFVETAVLVSELADALLRLRERPLGGGLRRVVVGLHRVVVHFLVLVAQLVQIRPLRLARRVLRRSFRRALLRVAVGVDVRYLAAAGRTRLRRRRGRLPRSVLVRQASRSGHSAGFAAVAFMPVWS